MIEDTIREIKETESEAAQITADAKDQCAQMIRDAQAKAAAKVSAGEAEALAGAAKLEEKEREAADAQIADAMTGIDAEIEALKQAALGRREQAVAAVIQALAE